MVEPSMAQAKFKLKMHMISPEEAAKRKSDSVESTPDRNPFLEATPLELDFGQVYLG